MEVEFNHDNWESIEAALDRYEEILAQKNIPNFDRMSAQMDLCAADGVNGNRPIDWDRLLAFDDFNFVHDVAGISNHIDRVTGQVMGHFLPRSAKKPAEADL